MDKRFEHDYIRRWRVIAMLENIKTHLNDNRLPQMVNDYIKFSKEIDENKWELKEIILAKCDEREREGYDSLTDSDIMDIIEECEWRGIEITREKLKEFGID